MKKVILFLLAFFTWLILSWSVDGEHIVVGLAIGAFVSLMTADIFNEKLYLLKGFRRYLWFILYMMVFLWECIKANLDGAYRVLHPDLPINPGIVKVKTALRSNTALTFLANSLTLKPGTMTVDIDKDNGFLYIHWVDVKSRDIQTATELIVYKFEKILKRIFE